MRVNAWGTVVSYDDYYSFGSTMRSYSSSADNRYKFTGKERDVGPGMITLAQGIMTAKLEGG